MVSGDNVARQRTGSDIGVLMPRSESRLERLQKVMASAGVASRRACEAMIEAGRVTVNGQVVTKLGTKVDPLADRISVDGESLEIGPHRQHTYLMLHKPPGYLSVFDDDRGRPGLEALVSPEQRLFPVGRLDLNSEGLLLLTDDGDLALHLTHPRYQHRRTYLVQLNRLPSTDQLARLRRGVAIEGGTTAPSQWQILEQPPQVEPSSDVPVESSGSSRAGARALQGSSSAWLRVTLREGRKRQIRRMAAAEGLTVVRLIRIAMGPLTLDRKLAPGQHRPLTREELRRLRSGTRSRPVSNRRSRERGAKSKKRGRSQASLNSTLREAQRPPGRMSSRRGQPGDGKP